MTYEPAAPVAVQPQEPQKPVADGVRYRRLRVLGCAPMLSANLAAGTVLRFTNLDGWVDADICSYPGRGDGPFDKPESPSEIALRNIASYLGVGGHNAPLVDAPAYEKKIIEEIERVADPVAAQPQGDPAAYICQAGCGCLWRDNKDGSMSLFNGRQKSCEVCEVTPLAKMTPLYTHPSSGPATDAEVASLLSAIRGASEVILATARLDGVEAGPYKSSIARIQKAAEFLASRGQA